MADQERLRALSEALAEAESRAKFAVACADWRAATRYCEKAADLERQIVIERAEPTGPTNVVGRVTVKG